MSPIRPENRDRYPADWKAISHRIRTERAAHRCECAGECGRPGDHLDTDTRCRNINGRLAYGTGSRVVLTVAHLNHTPEDCGDENLRAFCQGCHLHYDRDHHAETRARVIRSRSGSPPVTPAEEVAYLRTLAAEIAADTRLGRLVRLVTPAVLIGRADRITREGKAT